MKTLAKKKGGGGKITLDAAKNRFNWGAFFITIIWALCNKCWALAGFYFAFIVISLIAVAFVYKLFFVVLIIDFIIRIVCGIKGNEWAWKNNNWKSIEEFHKIQKIWSIVGIAIMGAIISYLAFYLFIFLTLVSGLNDSMVQSEIKIGKRKALSVLNTSIAMNAALSNQKMKPGQSAEWFSEYMSVRKKEGNKITATDETIYTFKDNGVCKTKGECYIEVDVNGTRKPNKKGQDIMTLPFYIDNEGFPMFKEEDTDAIKNLNQR